MFPKAEAVGAVEQNDSLGRLPVAPPAPGFPALITFILFAASCLQVWMFPFFPSQDGPSHSYNAAVLARYEAEPLWKEYFTVQGLGAGGSLASHLPLSILIRFFPAHIAEKILVTFLLGVFFVAYYYLFGSVADGPGPFSPCIAIAANNYFLYMGFWSFYASLAGMMIVAGYLIRTFKFGSLRSRDLAVLASGATLVYECHSFGWVILCAAIATIGLSRIVEEHRIGTRPRVMARLVAPILCCLPPAPALLFLIDWSAKPVVTASTSLRDQLWAVYSLSPLVALHWDELAAVRILAVALFAALCLVMVFFPRRRAFPSNAGILAAGILFALLGAFVPDALGGGSRIRERLILTALLFTIVWLAAAARTWPRLASAGVFLALSTACILSWSLRIPRIAEFNAVLSEYARVTSRISRGATVLPIGGPDRALRVDPFVHAVSYACIVGAVSLGNYEAQSVGFPVRFRPERRPVPALWTPADQLRVPPRLDIHRYEQATGGKVDFILLRADWKSGRILLPPGLEEFGPVDGRSSPHLLLLHRVPARKTAP